MKDLILLGNDSRNLQGVAAAPELAAVHPTVESGCSISLEKQPPGFETNA